MATDISGSYFGKSRPITQRILAGQGRGIGKANIVQNNVFYQQNNYGCCNRFDAYDYGCCGGDSGTPKWALWTMGIGGLLGALGNCFAGLRSSSSKPEGAGDAEPKDENAGLKDKINALEQKIADLENAGVHKKDEVDPEGSGDPKKPNYTKDMFTDLFTSSFVDTNLDPEKGLEVDGVYYTDIAEAYDAANGNEADKAVKAEVDADGKLTKDITINGVRDEGNNTHIGDTPVTIEAGTELPATVTFGNYQYKVETTPLGYVKITSIGGKGANSKDQTYIYDETGWGRQIDDSKFITNGTTVIDRSSRGGGT